MKTRKTGLWRYLHSQRLRKHSMYMALTLRMAPRRTQCAVVPSQWLVWSSGQQSDEEARVHLKNW